MNDTIILRDENGNNMAFIFMDLIKYDGDEYVILMGKEKSQSDEMVILKCEQDSITLEETYSVVEDSVTYEKVCRTFWRKFRKSNAC